MISPARNHSSSHGVVAYLPIPPPPSGSRRQSHVTIITQFLNSVISNMLVIESLEHLLHLGVLHLNHVECLLNPAEAFRIVGFFNRACLVLVLAVMLDLFA